MCGIKCLYSWHHVAFWMDPAKHGKSLCMDLSFLSRPTNNQKCHYFTSYFTWQSVLVFLLWVAMNQSFLHPHSNEGGIDRYDILRNAGGLLREKGRKIHEKLFFLVSSTYQNTWKHTEMHREVCCHYKQSGGWPTVWGGVCLHVKTVSCYSYNQAIPKLVLGGKCLRRAAKFQITSTLWSLFSSWQLTV